MEMLLMGACLSIFGLAVACLAFGAATREERAIPHKPEGVRAAAPAHFFVDQAIMAAATQPRIPIEALLLQIESHVRLEQAAAASFLEEPTPALLHSRTISPLVN